LALPAPSAAQLAKDVPSVCVPKVLNGLNLSELKMTQEILKDGTHVRFFRAPGSNKILIKMEDKGLLHKEWIYGKNGGPENFTFVKSVGNGDRYVVVKNGNHVQVEQEAIKYKDGINQKVSTNDLYYTNNVDSRYHFSAKQGFNGEETRSLDVVVNHPKSYHCAENVEARFNGLALTHRTKAQDKVYEYVGGLQNSGNTTAAEKVLIDVKGLQCDAKQHFLENIDEALFSPYMA